MWRKLATLGLGLLALASQTLRVASHGFMTEPASRNAQRNSNYCPHCLAAGGPGKTFEGGGFWPNSKHGVCGDPHDQPRDHEAGGKFATPPRIAAVYSQGQTITIRVKITAPHGGRFAFGLCPVPKGASAPEERAVVTQKCIDANQLVNAEDGSKFWWFGKRGVGEYTMQFRLPDKITCDRCVLQWHYVTGNSCTIPGTPEQHVMSAGMGSCQGSSVPEEFWNCADVRILPKGVKVPPTKAPTPAAKGSGTGTASSLGDMSPAQTRLLRDARLQQAQQLRQQAASATGSVRDLLLGQAAQLETLAKELGKSLGRKERFADFAAGGQAAAAVTLGPGHVALLAAAALVGAALPLTALAGVASAVAIYKWSAPRRHRADNPLLLAGAVAPPVDRWLSSSILRARSPDALAAAHKKWT
jgi:hypothetical protein